jgi:AcrR family transcriptional regulator
MNTGSSARRLRHREADLAGLLQAAERVFSDRGYHATSIRDIAREAGFSVGGVYQFFASKDELYLRIVEEQWEHFFKILNEALTADTTEGRLLGLTEGMFRAFEERRGFFKLFLSERGRLSAAFTGEIAQRVGERTRKLRAMIVDLMRAGVEEGLLRPAPPEMLASAFMGIVHNCIFEALASGAERPARATALVLAMFLHGAAQAQPAPDGAPAPESPEDRDQS